MPSDHSICKPFSFITSRLIGERVIGRDSTMMHIMMNPEHPADRLCQAIDEKAVPLCIGIDPVLDYLPEVLRVDTPMVAIESFCQGVIDAVSPIVPAVKFQSACFERYGSKGVSVLGSLRGYAKEAGMQIVLDVKRGDIGLTASHYAVAATIDGPADWVTLNPYLGMESITPFLEQGLGVFCLVRTSNSSGDVIQSEKLADGRTISSFVADVVANEGSSWIGKSGWSSLGAVVGATKPEDARKLRSQMQSQIFLMPGVGAQGGSVEDIRSCIREGHGALIPVSRSLLYPKQKSGNWQADIEAATKELSNRLQNMEEMCE